MKRNRKMNFTVINAWGYGCGDLKNVSAVNVEVSANDSKSGAIKAARACLKLDAWSIKKLYCNAYNKGGAPNAFVVHDGTRKYFDEFSVLVVKLSS